MSIKFGRILTYSILALAMYIAAAGLQPQSVKADSSAYPEVIGRWQSISCEMRPPASQPFYLKRDITITTDKVLLTFASFADPKCQAPTLTFQFNGKYEITGESAVVKGAKEATLTINDELRVAPNSDQMVAFLNSAGKGQCGTDEWKLNIDQSVLKTGCSVLGIKPNQVTTEYEILYVQNDFLFFAARPLDGSSPSTPEMRLSALQVPLLRVK